MIVNLLMFLFVLLPVFFLVFHIALNAISVPLNIVTLLVSLPLSLIDAFINRKNGYEGEQLSRVGMNVHEGFVVSVSGFVGLWLACEITGRVWTWLWYLVTLS